MSNTTKTTTVKKLKKAVPADVAEHLEGFKKFIKDQGLLGMAIGLILGTASGALVKSLIDNVIMPPIGLLLGSADGLKGLKLVMGRTASGEIASLNYGVFLNDLLNFVVIAAVVYVIIIFMTKFLGEEDPIKK